MKHPILLKDPDVLQFLESSEVKLQKKKRSFPINRSRDQRRLTRWESSQSVWARPPEPPVLPRLLLISLPCHPHNRCWNCAGKKRPVVASRVNGPASQTHKSLGRLTERVAPSGPLNEAQSECLRVEGGRRDASTHLGLSWREGGPPGARLSPGACCLS